MKPGIEIESDEQGHGAVAERGKTVVVRCDGFLHRGDAFQTNQILKLIEVTKRLNANVIGDDGERYSVRKNWLGRVKLVTLDP